MQHRRHSIYQCVLYVIKVRGLGKRFGKLAIEYIFHRLVGKDLRFNREKFLLFFIYNYLDHTNKTSLTFVTVNFKKNLYYIAFQ